jgi:hypothetical protein
MSCQRTSAGRPRLDVEPDVKRSLVPIRDTRRRDEVRVPIDKGRSGRIAGRPRRRALALGGARALGALPARGLRRVARRGPHQRTCLPDEDADRARQSAAPADSCNGAPAIVGVRPQRLVVTARSRSARARPGAAPDCGAHLWPSRNVRPYVTRRTTLRAPRARRLDNHRRATRGPRARNCVRRDRCDRHEPCRLRRRS